MGCVLKEVCIGHYLEFLLTWGYAGQRAQHLPGGREGGRTSFQSRHLTWLFHQTELSLPGISAGYAILRPHNLRNFNGPTKESSGRVKAGLGNNERCLAVHMEGIHYRPE